MLVRQVGDLQDDHLCDIVVLHFMPAYFRKQYRIDALRICNFFLFVDPL